MSNGPALGTAAAVAAMVGSTFLTDPVTVTEEDIQNHLNTQEKTEPSPSAEILGDGFIIKNKLEDQTKVLLSTVGAVDEVSKDVEELTNILNNGIMQAQETSDSCKQEEPKECGYGKHRVTADAPVGSFTVNYIETIVHPCKSYVDVSTQGGLVTFIEDILDCNLQASQEFKPATRKSFPDVVKELKSITRDKPEDESLFQEILPW